MTDNGYVIGGTALAAPGSAGERTRGGPLAGLRVLELAGLGPAPFCAMMLADQGATVLCIDRPGGDRIWPERGLVNRGRQSAVLDLKHPRDGEALLRPTAGPDGLPGASRPGGPSATAVGPEAGRRPTRGLATPPPPAWGTDG